MKPLTLVSGSGVGEPVAIDLEGAGRLVAELRSAAGAYEQMAPQVRAALNDAELDDPVVARIFEVGSWCGQLSEEPQAGFEANRDTLSAVYDHYLELYRQDDRLQWAARDGARKVWIDDDMLAAHERFLAGDDADAVLSTPVEQRAQEFRNPGATSWQQADQVRRWRPPIVVPGLVPRGGR